MKTTSVLIASMVVCGFMPGLRAQQSPASSAARTPAELGVRITELEQELVKLRVDNIRLQRDYTLLLNATCPAPAPSPPFLRDPAPSQLDAVVAPPPSPPGPDYSWFIKGIDFGVTERNRIFMRYAWTVTINNGGSNRPLLFDLAVQFLTANGLVIDTARAYRESVEAFGEQAFHGDTLISMPGALNVARAHAVVTPR